MAEGPSSSLAYRTRTKDQPSLSHLRDPMPWAQYAIPGTLDLTNTVLADTDSEDLYVPDDYIQPGMLVAYVATGAGPAYSGLWVPYLPNIAAANGEDVATGMVYAARYISRTERGAVEGAVANCSIIPVGAPVQVFASKMPEYNDHTAYAGGAGSSTAVAAADLPTGFINLDDLGVHNVGGL